MPKLLLALVAVFAPLSLATIGGGQAVVADIQRQVVGVHHWMTAAQFLDAFAISRMAPGPGSLLVTLIGWHVAGLWGAIVATLAIYMPTAFLIYGVAHLWKRYQGARWQAALEQGLRPVAAGMILAAVYVLFRSLDGGWSARVIALVSTGTLMTSRMNPLLLIACGAAVFIVAHTLLPALTN
jgi:chromate transporter